ncbi:hypothetical protein GCM10010106_38080 [Thermopolyspora flexuosa]|uniref:hypothetical protein n=1 Tax=Thermopolyspora flexuosa TaxID=103836 RepID=UPI001476A28E|nr:hypothetical protein [Thermopolyspora flexuosa]GGM87193.1 hypothetical protein GCM10010106_38080 [Thermopolyspora flexuosa]
MTQGGPYRLWDRVEASVRAWREAGAPSQDRFTIGITEKRQVVACPDHPGLVWEPPGS